MDTAQQDDAEMWTTKPASCTVPLVDPIITVAPIESRKGRDSRKGGGGHQGSDAKVKVEIAEGTMVEDGSVDMANALAKIRALTGMTRVQVSNSVHASWYKWLQLADGFRYIFIFTKKQSTAVDVQ